MGKLMSAVRPKVVDRADENLVSQIVKEYLNSKYKKMLQEKYKLEDEDFELISYDILEKIGRKRGCVISGGNIDMTKAALCFLEDLKSGKIGNISLDLPNV